MILFSIRVEAFQDLSLCIPKKEIIEIIHHSSLKPQKGSLDVKPTYVVSQQSWFSWFVLFFKIFTAL